MEPEFEAVQPIDAGEHQFFSDAEEDGKTYVPKSVKETKAPRKEKGAKGPDPKKRYIAFVGNLPYTVQKADLERLFKDLGTFTVACYSIAHGWVLRGIVY
jgi:RNA recognition motif-containing protein